MPGAGVRSHGIGGEEWPHSYSYPGFWLGAWAWDGVTRALRAAGHEVFPTTLTGLGDRAHLARPEVDLETHITDVINVIVYADLRDVVLVGHSGGGLPVAGAADRIAERIARAVYLDSGPLPEGMAQMDTHPPEARQRIQAQVAREGDGWRIPAPAWDDPTTRHACWLKLRGIPRATPRDRVHSMASIEDVAVVATNLPEVTEGERYGNRTWYVRGKAFAWERPIPHFDGYAAVLIALKATTENQLRETIIDAWLACAPSQLAAAYAKSLT